MSVSDNGGSYLLQTKVRPYADKQTAGEFAQLLVFIGYATAKEDDPAVNGTRIYRLCCTLRRD